MVAADAVAVAVTPGNDDLELVIGKLDAGRHCQSASMQRVHTVGTKIPRQVGRTADAADGHHLMRVQIQLHERLFQRCKHPEVAAARTPVRVYLAFKILDGYPRAPSRLLARL